MAECSAIILAGGAARRYPGGKLQRHYQGEPLLAHAQRTACAVAATVYIVGDQQIISSDSQTRCLPDDTSGQGPLAALLTGLRACSGDHAFLLGGDMPLIRPQHLEQLLLARESSSADLWCYRVGSRLQPMPTLLSCQLEVEISNLLAAGKRSLMSLLDAAAVHAIELDDPACLHDVDTPDDLNHLEKRGAEKGEIE